MFIKKLFKICNLIPHHECIVILLNSKLIFIYEREGYNKILLQSINDDFNIL